MAIKVRGLPAPRKPGTIELRITWDLPDGVGTAVVGYKPTPEEITEEDLERLALTVVNTYRRIKRGEDVEHD